MTNVYFLSTDYVCDTIALYFCLYTRAQIGGTKGFVHVILTGGGCSISFSVTFCVMYFL